MPLDIAHNSHENSLSQHCYSAVSYTHLDVYKRQVFQAPQCGHLPTQRIDSPPHSLQKKIVFALAIALPFPKDTLLSAYRRGTFQDTIASTIIIRVEACSNFMPYKKLCQEQAAAKR